MPIATLLLREESSVSLNLLVEKSLKKKPPLPCYNLELKSGHLDLILVTKSDDEGFESDIDSLSLVSNESETKTTESDSANGSASSDSDDTDSKSVTTVTTITRHLESYSLVDCCCYTDSKCSDLLIFVIKKEALVFKFDNLGNLRNFYVSFTALKAVANQKVYNLVGAKFNLLQRTDRNGVTHIEITRELPNNNILNQNDKKIAKYPSSENILDPKPNLKVWNSAEDLATPTAIPKRPVRKKVKAKAPPPPLTPLLPPPNTLSGQFVRVNVGNLDMNRMIAKSSSYQYNKEAHPKKFTSINNQWTNSVPRLLLKNYERNKPTQNRNFTPMAYRYIDTTTMPRNPNPHQYQTSMANRLFGLSPKLREFTRSNVDGTSWGTSTEGNSNLKSVIKKENKKKNDKKVTFSAYTTVQVV